MRILGCDIGKCGALGFLGDPAEAICLPYEDGELDCDAIAGQVRIWSPTLVVLEKPIPMPGLPSQMTLLRGYEYGRLYERFRMIGYPLRTVRPNEWTKHLGQPKFEGTTPQKQKKAKEWRISRCKELYPEIIWSTRFDSRTGQADALLMAWVASRGLV